MYTVKSAGALLVVLIAAWTPSGRASKRLTTTETSAFLRKSAVKLTYGERNICTENGAKSRLRWKSSACAESGENLNYSNIANTNITLLRAATRYFGTWEAAVNFAGLDYSQIRRYKSWSRDRIIARIRELNSQGCDLSWRNVSLNVDPQLAAAATKKSHFGSWREALNPPVSTMTASDATGSGTTSASSRWCASSMTSL